MPFCTRSWAAVTFFFFPPAAPSAFSAFCCSFFCQRVSRRRHRVGIDVNPTIDQIFNMVTDARGDRREATGRGRGLQIGANKSELGKSLPTGTDEEDR